MNEAADTQWRGALVERMRREAQPPEKFSHQQRLYRLTQLIGEGLVYDDDVVFAAAWVHDLGVFVGHRPERLEELQRWNSTAYTLGAAPAVLREVGFPEDRMAAVLDAIATHEAHAEPASVEATILRDADILEQLGAAGVARTLAKTGRDTRFITFADAARSLERALVRLPSQLRLDSARRLAEPRVKVLREFLAALEEESGGFL